MHAHGKGPAPQAGGPGKGERRKYVYENASNLPPRHHRLLYTMWRSQAAIRQESCIHEELRNRTEAEGLPLFAHVPASAAAEQRRNLAGLAVSRETLPLAAHAFEVLGQAGV